MDIICSFFGGTYTDLWQAVIRPGRDDYKIEELGPFRFEISGKCYKRIDFELLNKRGYKLQCSFWEPFDEEREYEKLPCVIYLHGNSSSRCEAFSEVKYLLPKNITLFSFDFCGCGKSEGNYISLGYYEKDDVDCVVEYLKKSKKVSKIALWGRSMGAVTAIMYAAKKQNEISAMILDSGYFSLKILIYELVEMRTNFPQFLTNKMLNVVKNTVKEKANFNMDDIETYNYSKKCNVPAFFLHGANDSFVKPHHCKDLYNSHLCNDKILTFVKGEHNSPRSKIVREDAVKFLIKRLFDFNNIDELEKSTIKNSHMINEYNYIKNEKRNKSNDNKVKKNSILTNFIQFLNSDIDKNKKSRQNFTKQNVKAYSYNPYEKNCLYIISKNNNDNNKNNNDYINNNNNINNDNNNNDNNNDNINNKINNDYNINNINKNKIKNKRKLNYNYSVDSSSFSLNLANKNNIFDEFSDVGDEMQDNAFKVEFSKGFGKIRPISLHNKIRNYKVITEINKIEDNTYDNIYKIFKKKNINNITELLKEHKKPSMIKIIGCSKKDSEWVSKIKGKVFQSTFYTDSKQNIKYVMKNAVSNRESKSDKKMEKTFKSFCSSKNEIKNKDSVRVNLNKRYSLFDGINPTPIQNHIKINSLMKNNILAIKEDKNNEFNTNTQDTIIDENEEIIGKNLPNP